MNRLQSVVANKLTVLWGLLLVVCAVVAIGKITSGSAFSSDITGLTPSAPGQAVEGVVRQRLASMFERRFLIMVSAPSRSSGLNLAKALEQELEGAQGVSVLRSELEADAVSAFYYPYRYQLLDKRTRLWLQNHTPEAIAQNTLEALYHPAALQRPYAIRDDPINLGGRWLSGLFQTHAQIQPTEIPSVKIEGSYWYIVKGELDESPFELAVQASLQQALTKFQDEHHADEYRFKAIRAGIPRIGGGGHGQAGNIHGGRWFHAGCADTHCVGISLSSSVCSVCVYAGWQ